MLTTAANILFFRTQFV